MKTYSVIQFTGSHQEVLNDNMPLEDARRYAKIPRSASSVVAVVADGTDEAIATEVYVAGVKIDSSVVRSIIFGLGRCM